LFLKSPSVPLFLPPAGKRRQRGIIRPAGGNLSETATLFHKIPPHLPLPKGGKIPLFGKEGLGEIL